MHRRGKQIGACKNVYNGTCKNVYNGACKNVYNGACKNVYNGACKNVYNGACKNIYNGACKNVYNRKGVVPHEAGACRHIYFNPKCPIRYSSVQSSSFFKKLGEPKNKAMYTQVYAGELVVSGL